MVLMTAADRGEGGRPADRHPRGCPVFPLHRVQICRDLHGERLYKLLDFLEEGQASMGRVLETSPRHAGVLGSVAKSTAAAMVLCSDLNMPILTIVVEAGSRKRTCGGGGRLET